MSSSFAARIAARFAPLDFANVYGFPNTVPDIKIWGDILPKFGEYEDDNPGQHLFEFHKLMEELNVHHEDVLMKLFMFSLENDARLWYKSLPHSSIPSLKCFHTLFHQHCKRIYSAEILFEDCCDTSPLEEEEETIEISRVDENDQYEEELAHEDAGSCELTQEEVFKSTVRYLDSEPIFVSMKKDMAAMFNDPEHHKSEHRVVMDVLKPQYDMFFQDPFADLLDSFNGGICYVMNIWSQELMKGSKIHDHQQVRWGLSISFFSLLGESVRKFQRRRQLLDWLHWHFHII
jgi:hypothetical protein